MTKIIRTSDLKLGKLQEVQAPKYKPLTTTKLGDILAIQKADRDRVYQEAAKKIIPKRPIIEKLVTTESVSEFNAKYRKVIEEETSKLAEKKEKTPKKKRTYKRKKKEIE